ncbi:MAG: holin [Prevotellaceae bacterium]|nr:holin [Prevotellaceae bacterium]
MRDWKKWIKCAGIRAAKTFAQTAVSLITVGQMVTELNWLEILGISATSAIVSILTSIAGLPEEEA